MHNAGSVRLLRWLYEHTYEQRASLVMQSAACCGEFEKLLFLKEKQIDQFDWEVAVESVKRGKFEIYQWLRANDANATLFRIRYIEKTCEIETDA